MHALPARGTSACAPVRLLRPAAGGPTYLGAATVPAGPRDATPEAGPRIRPRPSHHGPRSVPAMDRLSLRRCRYADTCQCRSECAERTAFAASSNWPPNPARAWRGRAWLRETESPNYFAAGLHVEHADRASPADDSHRIHPVPPPPAPDSHHGPPKSQYPLDRTRRTSLNGAGPGPPSIYGGEWPSSSKRWPSPSSPCAPASPKRIVIPLRMPCA
jgi:hypothetical protein